MDERPTLWKDSSIYLLGSSLEKLSTKLDVLRHFFYIKDGPIKENKHTLSNSPVADVVYKNVEQQWDYGGIATQWKKKVKEKFLKLDEEYRSVQKRRGNSSNVQKETLLIESLD